MGLKAGAGFAIPLIFLVLASMAALNQAATKIVGGSEGWHYGYNYEDWATKNAPFYRGDTLVFQYDPPTKYTHPNSVYKMKNRRNFRFCNFQNATLLAGPNHGTGSGFAFTLGKRKRYFFACGELEGLHCLAGLMKFSVKPLKLTN